VSSRGVHDDEVAAVLAEQLHASSGNQRGVCLRVAAVEGDGGLGGVLLQLVKRTWGGAAAAAGGGDSNPGTPRSSMQQRQKGMEALVAFCFRWSNAPGEGQQQGEQQEGET
jgi:hypothetical protein